MVCEQCVCQAGEEAAASKSTVEELVEIVRILRLHVMSFPAEVIAALDRFDALTGEG